MRGYFSVRSFIKAMLKSIGLYKLFAHHRNKGTIETHAELKNGRQDSM
jgi:hypothetical protein